MRKKVIIINGCDANFYPFMDEAQRSLMALGLDLKADFGAFDLGLTEAQRQAQSERGCRVVTPGWTIDVPQHLRKGHEVGLVARTALRDYFPGYDTYIWFDADAWAQTREFFTLMLDGVAANGAALIREDGPGYRMNMMYRRWWYGHMMAAFGPVNGLKVSLRPVINIGIVALGASSPIWEAWIRDYEHMVEKRQRVNLDQHAFNSAVVQNNLSASYLPARCNWICTLSPPRWDPEKTMFCEPGGEGKPLSVLHLAGPNKRRPYKLATTIGNTITTALDFPAALGLVPAARG